VVFLDHRDRVLAAIALEEPDRAPMSLQFSEALLRKMLDRYSIFSEGVFRREPGLGARPYEEGALPSEVVGLCEKLGCDLLHVEPTSPEGWQPVRLEGGVWRDEWGVLCQPRVPGTIDWFVHHPIERAEDLEDYEFPDPEAPGRFRLVDEVIKKYGDEFAIVSGFGWCLFERAWLLRGFAPLIRDMRVNPRFVEKLMDKIVEYDLKLARLALERSIDIFYVGDDYGGQDKMLVSPTVWRRFIKPRLQRILEVPRSRGIPIALHSDGNIFPIIGDLIEIGVSILNPVQPLALDPAVVKEGFGEKLCLFGTIDIQKTLPFGTPLDVKEEILRRMMTVGQGGGLIFAPTHTILPDVPVENILAMVEAIHKFGRYPLRLLETDQRSRS